MDTLSMPAQAKNRSRLRRRSVGVVMVEYTFLLTFVAVPIVIGTMAFGLGIIQGYGAVRNSMLHSFP